MSPTVITHVSPNSGASKALVSVRKMTKPHLHDVEFPFRRSTIKWLLMKYPVPPLKFLRDTVLGTSTKIVLLVKSSVLLQPFFLVIKPLFLAGKPVNSHQYTCKNPIFPNVSRVDPLSFESSINGQSSKCNRLPEGPMFEISRSTFHFSYHQSRGVFRRF